ncbi:hypothetical protein AVDCRST_MAG84-166, partial [uncultured Microcoleus sp.]
VKKPSLYGFAENGAKYQVERSVKNTNLLGRSASTQPTFGDDFSLGL